MQGQRQAPAAQAKIPSRGDTFVRVFGLLLVVLAGPAIASELGESPTLARFAYANSPAFVTSVEPATVPPSAHLRLLTLVAAEHLAAQSSRLAPADEPPREDQGPEQPPLEDGVQAAPGGSAPAAAASGRQPAPARLSALPEAMHVLTHAPTDADATPVVSTKKSASRPSTAKTRAKRRRKARRTRRRSAPVAQRGSNTAEDATVPRWAAQMFDTLWQRRAFAYQ